MRRLTALLLVALAAPGCDAGGPLSEEEALDVTCLHAAGAFGVMPFAGGPPTQLQDIARVLEIDARLLGDAGAEDAAELVSETAAALERELAGGRDVTAHLSDDSSQAERDALEAFVAGLPGVESVEFVSSDEAYERYLESGKDAPGVSADTLPDSIEIFAADDADEGEIAEELEGEPIVDEIRFSGDLEPVRTLQRLGSLCELPP